MVRTDNETEVERAELKVIEIVTRLVHCGAAFGATIVVANVALGIPYEHAREAALLNAGVAYYTTEVSGLVTRTLNGMYRKASATDD